MDSSSKCHLFSASLLLLMLAVPVAATAQFQYMMDNGTITIMGYTGPGGAVTIPSTINGLPVTAIGTGAWLGHSELTSITIQDNVSSIGMQAFQGCGNLNSVTIGKSVTRIGNDAFDSCSNLTSVRISNGVTVIAENAFSRCTSLASIGIPDSVTSIPDQAFQSCSNLTSITIGSGVTNLGNNAFEYCTSLASIHFLGNAPTFKALVLYGDTVTVYYLPGSTGWGPTFSGRPTMLWNRRLQTIDAAFGVRSNQFGFNITGTSNLVIVVETTTDLAGRIWYPLQTNTLNGGSLCFSDPQWMNYPMRFYRLRSP